MLPPDAAKRMQSEIDAVVERAKSDPTLQVQVDEARAAAQQKHDAALAARTAGAGLVGAVYGEFLGRGLFTMEK